MFGLLYCLWVLQAHNHVVWGYMELILLLFSQTVSPAKGYGSIILHMQSVLMPSLFGLTYQLFLIASNLTFFMPNILDHNRKSHFHCGGWAEIHQLFPYKHADMEFLCRLPHQFSIIIYAKSNLVAKKHHGHKCLHLLQYFCGNKTWIQQQRNNMS